MRMLHTMLRVGDLDKSLAFYQDVLGMKLLRREDFPADVLLWLLSAMVKNLTVPYWN